MLMNSKDIINIRRTVINEMKKWHWTKTDGCR